MNAQSTYLLKIPQISPDTVLVLDKKAAILQGNFNKSSIQLKERFKASLIRHERLIEVWEKTEQQLSREETLNENLKEQILELQDLADTKGEETKAVTKACKKLRRKSFVNGLLVGVAAGAIGTIVIISQ